MINSSSGELKYASCELYAYNFEAAENGGIDQFISNERVSSTLYNSRMSKDIQNVNSLFQSNSTVIPCKEWVYDESQFDNTIASQVGLSFLVTVLVPCYYCAENLSSRFKRKNI